MKLLAARTASAAALLLALLHTTTGAGATTLATPSEYDVIVIGSGPGGLVAAEYLTRATYNLSVLMLEAGDVSLQASGGKDTLEYAAASGFTKFDIPGEFDNTIYNTANEKYRIEWISSPYMWLGKLLGGCSSINAALYFRTPDSYVEKASWPYSATQVSAGFDANEKFFQYTETPSSDGKKYLQEAYEIVGDALTGIGYSAQTLNAQDARNSKNMTFGHPPYAIAKGLRDAPAKTFYSEMKDRSNFALLTNSKVLYVQQTSGQATGVVYENAAQEEVTAKLSSRGVVVMAAGALNTPQVLMQSGIGPKKELEALAALNSFDGVSKESWVENANVGQSVFDANVVYASLSHTDMKPFLNKKRPEDAITQYVKDQSGPWSNPGPVLVAYETMNVGDREYDLQTTILPHGFGDDYETDEAYTMSLFVNNPESRDYISVSSSDAGFNVATQGSWYLSTSNDLKVLQSYATKMITAATEAGSVFLNGKDASATGIAAWVKTNAGSVTHHFGGSCYTSSDTTDSKRCADESFKVIGTKNIYVSDASLMKEGTVNPYGFVMYIGHQAAKNVLESAFQVAASSSSPSSDSTDSGATPSSGDASQTSSAVLAGDVKTTRIWLTRGCENEPTDTFFLPLSQFIRWQISRGVAVVPGIDGGIELTQRRVRNARLVWISTMRCERKSELLAREAVFVFFMRYAIYEWNGCRSSTCEGVPADLVCRSSVRRARSSLFASGCWRTGLAAVFRFSRDLARAVLVSFFVTLSPWTPFAHAVHFLGTLLLLVKRSG